MKRLALALVAAACLAAGNACATVPPGTGDHPARTLQRQVAITIDDLPWATLGDTAPPSMQAHHDKLIKAMADSGAPIIGFVNEGKLVSGGKVDTTRVHLLRDWLKAGFELGNHTHGHLDLHAVGLDAYLSDILRGETFLRPLLAETGREPVWFRHPYLRAGRSAADKAALADFLGEHGYRIAPVTVDNSDWIWASAYRRSLAASDGDLQARLRAAYVPYMLSKLDYFEAQSQALLGYNLPHVLLMHANELNADTFSALAQGMRDKGYSFIALEQALRDPAYLRPDDYTGRYGPSWLHRWAIAEKRPATFFEGDPRTPEWVRQSAGVDAE